MPSVVSIFRSISPMNAWRSRAALVVVATVPLSVLTVGACSADSRPPSEIGDCTPHDGVVCAPRLVRGLPADQPQGSAGGNTGGDGTGDDGGGIPDAGDFGGDDFFDGGLGFGGDLFDGGLGFGTGGGDNSPGGAGVAGGAPGTNVIDAAVAGGFGR